MTKYAPQSNFMVLIFQNRLHSIKILRMQKHLYAVILFTTIFCMKGWGQALPPVITSSHDNVGDDDCTIYFSFSPNDTGTIQANIVIQQGQGNSVFDSTFILTAADSANVQVEIDSLTPCTQYQVLTIMSNAKAVGLQSNPLLTFNTICAGIELLNPVRYSLMAMPKSVEVIASEVAPGQMIEIYDLTGKEILTTSFHQSVQQIPFNQNAGIYLLRITGNGQSLYTNRFVIY
jgi:hypothetical protein